MSLLQGAAQDFPKTSVGTLSGHLVNLIDPDPKTIDPEDIIDGLSRLPRFNGHTNCGLKPGCAWKVSEHSVLALDITRIKYPDAPDLLKKVVLLHDGHEVYTNDIVTPMKRAVRAILRKAAPSLDLDPITMIQDGLQDAIHMRFGLPPWTALDPGLLEMVHDVDNLSFQHECFWLRHPTFKARDGVDFPGVGPVVPTDPETAAETIRAHMKAIFPWFVPKAGNIDAAIKAMHRTAHTAGI